MKVPTIQSNRVAEGSGQLAYLQTPSNLGDGWNALARGISSLGGALSQYGAAADAEAKQREEKTKRFDALTALNDFELEGDVTQTELKRQTDASGKDFGKQSSELWNKRAEEFISTRIPEDLREEFRYRLSENRQKVLRDAYDFEYKAGDAWFRKGISEQLVKAQNEVGRDITKLPEWQKKIDEVIDASDLSQAEKDELRSKAHLGLVSVEYYQQVKTQARQNVEVGVTDFSDEFKATKALIRKEEDYAPNSYYDTNAERIGFGSDTITRGGKQYTVKKGDRVTRQEAEDDLEYRLQQREGAAVRRQLKDEWGSLPNNIKAALYSVGYNYGSLPSSVVKAVKTGDVETIAGSIENLSANKSRRKREANIVRGSASIDLDAKYDAIPFDDRVQMRNAAEREAKQEYNEQQKLLAAQEETARNDLYTGLFDGNKNEVDIQAARDSGLLRDIDHIEKAHKILEDRNEQVNLTTGFNEILSSGRPLDPTDEDQKKMYNAWVGPDGLNKLMSGDKQYFAQVIKPAYERVGAMATDVSGALQGMMRSGTLAHRQFAVDALAQLQDANPTAFAAQIPEAIQRQVDYWDRNKAFYEDPKELITQLDGGKTAEERQLRITRRKDAEQILSRSVEGIPTIENLMQEVLGSFDNTSMPWVPDPKFSADPIQKQAVYREFETHFINEYERYGSVEEARDAAIRTMKNTWGVSPIGEGSFLMKYPPNMVGYKPGADGTYSWIDNQIRTELKLGTEKSYELVSDEITRQQWESFRAGGNQPPTYRVIVKDENGVYRDPSDDPTQRTRMWFEKPAVTKQQEENAFDLKNEIFNLQDRLEQIIQMKMQLDRAKPGAQLPDELLEEEKEINEKLQEITPSDRAIDNIPEPTMDIMGNTF